MNLSFFNQKEHGQKSLNKQDQTIILRRIFFILPNLGRTDRQRASVARAKEQDKKNHGTRRRDIQRIENYDVSIIFSSFNST